MKEPEEFRAYTESLAEMATSCSKHGGECLTDATRVCFLELIASRDTMSQDEIAPHFGGSHSRIQQIERDALKKLGRLLTARGLDLSMVWGWR